MKMKSLLLVAAFCAMPVLAQSENPPEDPPPPAEEESDVAGRVESIEETLTEAKNILDALSRLKVSGYVQAQYVQSERSRDEATGPGGTRNLDQFSIRRGRVKFTYQMTPTSRFVLQPDFTTSGVTLKDGYVELIEPWTTWHHTLTAGQFSWPFGFEIMYSSSAREMPERSLVVRTLFPGERDRGAMLSGTGFGEKFHYRAAVVNGTGTTQSFDFNQRKDFVARTGYAFGPVDIAASIYRGAELVSLNGLTAGREFQKRREGIDFQWVTALPGLGVRGEYIRGVQPPAAGTALAAARAADVDGWYLYAIQNVGTRHQFVLRADEYDPNLDRAGDATRTVGGSYIFHWDAASKVMFAYEQPRLETNDPADDVWTVRYQFNF